MSEETKSHVPSGYEIGRDDEGLTERERTMKRHLLDGMSASAASKAMGMTRQRGSQLAASLVQKGALKKEGRKYVPAVRD